MILLLGGHVVMLFRPDASINSPSGVALPIYKNVPLLPPSSVALHSLLLTAFVNIVSAVPANRIIVVLNNSHLSQR